MSEWVHMRVSLFGMTDCGRLRGHNEDSILVAPEHHLAVVADGMGGHEAGEVASKLAVDAIHAWFHNGGDDGASFKLDPALPPPVRRLVSSVLYADQSIRQAASATPGRLGMGTTVVAAVVDTATQGIYVAHAGDSRAYLCRNKGLVQVTYDHSVVQDLLRAGVITDAQATHVKKNAITRALGVTDGLAVDVDQVNPQPGDTLLLCSDGLHGMITDDEIARVLAANMPLEETCKVLINLANEAGGSDNISAVVARVDR